MHRLGVGWSLRRTLSATNPIELCLSTVERMARNVKRWRGGDQPLRSPATACAKPRRNSAREGVSGTRNLASRIDRLNPYTLCDMQQSWGRRNQLKPGTTFGVEEFLFVFAIQSFLRIRRPWIEQIRASHNIRRINELDLQKQALGLEEWAFTCTRAHGISATGRTLVDRLGNVATTTQAEMRSESALSSISLSMESPRHVACQRVSIIIPIYNERQYVERILQRVEAAPLPDGLEKEIIMVDDGSTDGTTLVLEGLHRDRTLKVHHSVLNFGKGTAIRVGLHYASGEFILIQDGDLEYDPNEYGELLKPLIAGEADVVYGSRFIGKLSGMRWQNYLANKVLTWLANILFGAKITDEATGYKAFRRDVLLQVQLRCKRFEFCPEVTAKVRKKGFRIHEVPISYEGRTAQQGKKIRLKDGLEAVWTLFRCRFRD